MKCLISLACLWTLALANLNDYQDDGFLINKEPRIYKGKTAKHGQFPWHVAIATAKDSLPVCGGSLIHPDYVLTAAHCIWFTRSEKYYLTFGMVDYTEKTATKRETTKWVLHEKYDGVKYDYDMAVMFIDTIQLTDNIKTIQMAYLYLGANEDTVASGFGYQGKEIGRTNDLQYAELKTISNEECKKTYSFLIDKHICTKGLEMESTCRGDSGGPLVHTQDNETILVGVISFGSAYGCEIGKPEAATRVEPYYEWILNAMQKLISSNE